MLAGGIPNDDDDVSEEDFERLEARTETLLEVVSIMDDMIETASEMDSDEYADQIERMETTQQTCREMAISFSIVLEKRGYWDDGLDSDDDKTYY